MKKVMSLADLKGQSTIGSIVEKEIEFVSVNGENCEAKVFVRKLGYQAIMDIQKAITWEFNEQDIEKSKVKQIDVMLIQATRVLHTICSDRKGTPLFKTVDQVYDLVPTLGFALYAASDEVNNFLGKSAKENSEKKSSGVNLSSMESVEEPLKKQKRTSRTKKPASGVNTDTDEGV